MTTDTARLVADMQLVARAQAGDDHALHDLIAALRPAIVRYCHFRLASYAGGSDAADDAAQETCLALANVLHTYRDQGMPFTAWVYAIAGHKVADSQRRFGRARMVADEFPEQVEPSLTPEERAIASAELRAALGLIELLPARQRAVLLQRASGATTKMVAGELGISAGAVDVAYHRAITRVNELVDSSEEFRELFAAFRRSAPSSTRTAGTVRAVTDPVPAVDGGVGPAAQGLTWDFHLVR
jgi:RNA polymerase sigma-70 factor (ECF subfamily)